MDWIYRCARGTLFRQPGRRPARGGDDMQTIRRDVLKTLSFAALHFGVAFTVAYALTGSVAIATGIGLIEPLANTVAFYFHERAWRRVDGGEPSRNNAPVMCCGALKAR
jgi:uncharacterized membrane protein